MSDAVIRTTGLTRAYSMGESVITALRDADLIIHSGEFIALMGASGSGKSTLLNLLGFEHPADEEASLLRFGP